MLRFREACNGCSFYFLACFDKIFAGKNSFVSVHLKLSLPMVLKCFLIFPNFSLMFLLDMFLIKKRVVE